jgi:hypothetical protein
VGVDGNPSIEKIPHRNGRQAGEREKKKSPHLFSPSGIPAIMSGKLSDALFNSAYPVCV